MSRLGPAELGRGIVILPGGAVPERLSKAPRYRLDQDVLTRPGPLTSSLLGHWLRREPFVLEMERDLREVLKEPEELDMEPYRLEPGFDFAKETLHFLVWANTLDATLEGEPVWWLARLARARGARSHPEADVDIDGPVWTDGGPRGTAPFPVLHKETLLQGGTGLTRPWEQPPPDLAPDQVRAVCHGAGAARVLAPAGSGKTRVLTSRLSYLLGHGFEPNLITAVAYNKRAAREMRQRLQSPNLQVHTVHSLGYAIVRRRHQVTVAGAGQVRSILRGLVRPPARLNSDPLQPYLEALQEVRLQLKDPSQVEAARDDVPGLSELFPRYRRRLAALKLVDYDEQIYQAIELLLKDASLRKEVQAHCTHLLVDEFQDLTPSFLLLLRLVAAPAYQVFGVGDDDQVIYGYAGATPDYLVNFRRYFPGARTYQLEVNYRCPPSVVALAARLLDHNSLRVEKDVHVDRRTPHRPQLLSAPQTAWTEVALQWLGERLQEFEPSEVAILSRVNALLLPIQVALGQAGLPHNTVLGEEVLERTGVRTALAYWRLCDGSGEMSPEDLSDALRRPNRMLKTEYIERASRCRDRTALQRLVSDLDSWPASQLEEFLHDLAFLSRQRRKGPARFFQALQRETRFLEALDQLDSAGLGSAGSSHGDDLMALQQLGEMCPDHDFEGWLRAHLAEPAQLGGPGIRLSSVHRVKGLEWPCVLIFGVEEGLFPHRLAEDVEEERRILHVALTRTREHCALVASPDSASPFLKEMRL